MKEYVTPIDLGGLPPIDERRKKLADSANDFINYFRENRIFMTDDICHLLDEISKCLLDAWHKFNIKDRVREDVDNWDEAWSAVTEKLPLIRKKLEKVFRCIIGIEDLQ